MKKLSKERMEEMKKIYFRVDSPVNEILENEKKVDRLKLELKPENEPFFTEWVQQETKEH